MSGARDSEQSAEQSVDRSVESGTARSGLPEDNGKPTFVERMQSMRAPWLWSFAGAVVIWLVTSVVFGFTIASNVVTTALVFATFMVFVGIGQMLVITAGPGNIDLSMPSAIALSGVLGVQLMKASDGLILLGIGAALGVGIAVGLANYLLIRALRIPPIIATLSSSFIVQSVAITQSRGMPQPPPALQAFSNGRLLGLPNMAWLALALSVVLGFVLHRTVFGRTVSALGQNSRAAWLAGVRVERVRCAIYVLAAIIASFTGFLLAAISGGAALDMGVEYMLISVAVVVIGGTEVTGGQPSIAGVWGASLFLFLTNAMLNALGAGAGVRSVAYGVLIIAVVAVARRRVAA